MNESRLACSQVEMLSTAFRRLPVVEGTRRAYETAARFVHAA